MKFRRNKKDFFEFENDRKTHVKLYKAGKQWVSSLISSIGLIRVFKGRLDKSAINTQLVSKEKDKKSEDKLSSDGIAAALKGAAALGAVAGGTVLTANTALADTKQLDSNQNLATKDTVNLSSGSGSSSVSDSLSTSESNVQSEASVSKSESVSLNTNTNSSSTSETRSDSNSRSESISESKSDSNSQSVSSQTTSKSESLASTSLENSQTTTGTTAKDKLQGLINQATDFVNSDAFKSSSSDLKPALAAAVKQYATVMQSSMTEQDYQYGIYGLTSLMNEIKTPSIKFNNFMVNAQTNSSLGTPDKNTDPKDTPAYWGNDGKNNYKWIPGDKDNRLWWDINAYTSRDTHQTIGVAKNNVEVKKEDLGGGKTQWTITFYPGQGVYYAGYKASDYGLVHAQMGFYLTKDYKINSDVNVHISLRSGTTYYYKGLDFPLGTGLKVRTSANDPASGDVNPKADITFKPGDVNKTNGVISDTPSKFYQFGRYADIWNMPDNFDNSVFSGRVSDTNDKIGNAFAFNNEFDNATARDGQNSKDMVVNKAPFTDSFNEKTIGTAMYLQSWGDTSRTMAASYTVTFTTLHSNADQADLAAGNYNGAFSGVYAIANTYQNGAGWDYFGTKYTSYPTLQGQLVGQEVYNYDKDTKTIDPTIPSELTSESTSESESASKSSS
ncbi:accessory Sec-dependent LPXTG-anchored adhesin, partial [Ligilactobacillus salivarius]|uniref:accessory Sec-dependent serine-rich glycoprotein adhesin n=1 Tax=Ligilactobacillus salivarius TaxID=1624 RepID=UPI000C151B73